MNIFNESKSSAIPTDLPCIQPIDPLNHRNIPRLRPTTRNAIFGQQTRKIRIRARRKIMREVIVHIMHRDARRVRSRA